MTASPLPERVVVLANAAAGTAQRAVVDRCVGILEAVVPTTAAWSDGPEDLAHTIDTLDPRTTLVVAGGDGSLNVVANLLESRGRLSVDRPLGLLPLGTGNDFARTVGVAQDPGEAASQLARALAEGRTIPLDAAIADDDRVVVNTAHVGVGAVAARRGQRLKKAVGPLGYLVGAAASAAYPPLRVTVTVDGRTVVDVDEPVLMVGISNGRTMGGGTPLAPTAAPDDHLLDVVVSRPHSAGARLGFGLALRRGEHRQRDDVTSTRGSVVRVAGESFEVNEDGELLGARRVRTWRVRPQAWALYRP